MASLREKHPISTQGACSLLLLETKVELDVVALCTKPVVLLKVLPLFRHLETNVGFALAALQTSTLSLLQLRLRRYEMAVKDRHL